MKQIWDISQTIHAGLPVWPGEPAFALERLAQIDDSCPVNVSKITLSTHTGTHADSPLHYDRDGLASSQCSLDPYLGTCQVIDARHAQGRVELEDIADVEIVAPRVLFRTYSAFPHDGWRDDFTAISPEVVERLARNEVVLIGTDVPSLDPQTSKTMDAHKVVLRNDMRILEGLVLDDVAPGIYELLALPLKIADSDASPLRAILREI